MLSWLCVAVEIGVYFDLVELPLCLRQSLFVLTEKPGIVDELLIAGDREVVKADINADRFIALRKEFCFEFTGTIVSDEQSKDADGFWKAMDCI